MNSSIITELRKKIKVLVREEILLPAQNFESRIVRPDAEIASRVCGDFKTVALAVFGIKLLLEDSQENTDYLSFWNILSNLLEYSPQFSLLQNSKIQILLLEEELAWENILNEDYFGKTPEEIFGYLCDPERKSNLRNCYRLYTRLPKTPKRIQRHRGYRDKGSLPGDKAFLSARNFDQDSKLQVMREEYKSYQYTFQELKELLWGRGS